VTNGRSTRLALAAGAALALADASIVTLALPRLLTELEASVEGVAAVIGVYTVVMALALLPAEALRRRVGAPQLGLAAFVLFAAACVGCAAASSLELLLALRAVQALGGAGALVATFALLGAGGEGSPGRRLWTAAAVLGVAAGPALGGILTQALDWRAIFAAQVPVALLGAAAAARAQAQPRAPEAPPPAARDPQPAVQPQVALALVSAALTGALFLLVLLLVAGWNLSPLAAALTVTVLPLAAVAAGRVRGDPRARAATGCALVAGGTAALAFLPTASALWTVVPQLMAGAGMGLALPALAGELVPERSPGEASRLLSARHAGIALALLALAPIVSSNLSSATERARERGVAIVLDAPLPPQSKIKLAPAVLAGVRSDEARRDLERALDDRRGDFPPDQLPAYDRIAERADDTFVQAVADSFRTAFLIAAALALAAALLVLPEGARLRALARAAAAALAVVLVYVLLDAAVPPDPVTIADPCETRRLPDTGGLSGVIQDQALGTLDQVACHFGSSREELVLALASDADARRFQQRHGVNPRSAGDLLQGLSGN
jgi:MFS family permease